MARGNTMRVGALLLCITLGCALSGCAAGRALLHNPPPVPTTKSANFLAVEFSIPAPWSTSSPSNNPGGVNKHGHVSGFGSGTSSTSYIFDSKKSVLDPQNAFSQLNIQSPAFANGLNDQDVVVGGGLTSGFGAFFYENGAVTPIPAPKNGATNGIAFGINDNGDIVGQYMLGDVSPGFIFFGSKGQPNFNKHKKILPSNKAMVVNAQAVNNHQIVTGFFTASDQAPTHSAGFLFNARNGHYHVAKDVVVPNGWSPLVFTQFLGISDSNIVVGYYGDETGSQHGFIYDASTNQYLLIFDHPLAANISGVVITQLTGISADGKLITGFYTDASGIQQGFVIAQENSLFPIAI